MSEIVEEEKYNSYPPEEQKSAPQSLENSAIGLNAGQLGPINDEEGNNQYLALCDLTGQNPNNQLKEYNT